MSFKRVPKMKTTEPSVDEAGPGMKKGGKASGGAMGALPTAARLATIRPRGAALLSSRAPMRPTAGIPAVKSGGRMESMAEEKREEREIKGLKSELKSHEGKKASKAHAGLKCGGMTKKATGGVVEKFATGGVIKKFATGGVIEKFACGGAVKGHDSGGHKSMKKGGSW